jgi:hypothetical protein
MLGLLTLIFADAARGDDGPVDAARPSRAQPLRFESDIVPILRAYCWKCHGGEGREADLDLRSLPLAVRGGKSGPALVAGTAADSRLFQRVSRGEMPPGDALKPTAEHLALIEEWLNAGAPAAYVGEELPPFEVSDSDREWWSFRKPVRPGIPGHAAASPAGNPVDAFLLAKLEPQQLTFSPPADRATWLRRISFDLVGLPPRPEELDDFLLDESPDAPDRLVDRLMASPHFGERWGRHWLDAAGYVDTIGSDNDAGIMEEREGIWKYRDYVIRAFNADRPFDRFLLEQIAGDEIVDWKSPEKYDAETLETLIATGFLRQAADVTYAPELNTSDIRHQVLYDTVQILSTNVLGLTLHCAQCHDHKFDPISQAEYYQFLAYFAPAYDPQHWKHSRERHLFDVPPKEQAVIDAHNGELDKQIQEQQALIAGAKEPFAQKLREAKLAALPEAIRADTQAAVGTPAEKRTEIQKYLAEKLGPLLVVNPPEIDQALDEPARAVTAQANAQIAQLTANKRTYGKLQSLWNVGDPRMYLYRRGDYQTPGPEIHPGPPAILTSAATNDSSAGLRTSLAKWLTQPDHPLTGRVYVNRVWQSFFGRGIVETQDNFGVSGAPPTHPELLDCLAVEFVQHDWSVKQLLRHIVTSAAYRQASQTAENSSALHRRGEMADADNWLLWRMPLRRMESEMVRDAMLAASGSLDEKLYGPPLALKPHPDGRVEVDPAKLPPNASPFRRSMYLFCRRNYQLTELSVFDQPVISHNCTRRINTAVVLQSLTMLNGDFAQQRAERLRQAVQFPSPDDPSAEIERAFRLTLNRNPDAEELTSARDFLQRQQERLATEMPAEQAAAAALDHLCLMLFNVSEFVFVP